MNARERNDFEQKPLDALVARHVGRSRETSVDERLPNTTVCFPGGLEELGLDDRLEQEVSKRPGLCIDLALAVNVHH